jgi:hypothetical protein
LAPHANDEIPRENIQRARCKYGTEFAGRRYSQPLDLGGKDYGLIRCTSSKAFVPPISACKRIVGAASPAARNVE